MKAMVITKFGGPEVFEADEVSQPAFKADEVLVKVHATSVNPIDLKIRQAGAWAGVNPPAVIGYDVSGEIVAVGDAVRRLAVGEQVYYTPELRTRAGSYAEYNAAPASIVARKPINLSHEEAASLPLAGSTAFEALILKAKLRVGETALIHGCGGVGSLALQIAKAAGAYVIVVCSDYMTKTAEALGADYTINYKNGDFAAAVQKATDGFGVDVVLDTVGSDTITRSLEVTKPYGRIVGIVSTDTGVKAAFSKNITLFPMMLERAYFKLDALRDMAERGQLKPVIDTVLPLDKVAEAHKRLEKGGIKGKIVLRVPA